MKITFAVAATLLAIASPQLAFAGDAEKPAAEKPAAKKPGKKAKKPPRKRPRRRQSRQPVAAGSWEVGLAVAA
jgi:hypothetical protein